MIVWHKVPDKNYGMSKEHYSRARVILAMDVIVSVVSSLTAILLVRWLTAPVFQFSKYVAIWLGLALVGTFAGVLIEGSHKVILRHSTFRNIGKLATAIVIKEVLLLACVLLDIFSINDVHGGLLIVVLNSLLSFTFLILVRAFILAILDSRKDSVDFNVGRKSVMVFGTTNKSASLVPRFEFSPQYNVIGILTNEDGLDSKILMDKRIYGCTSEEGLRDLYARLGGIDCVMFATPEEYEGQAETLVKWCVNLGIQVLMAPRVEQVELAEIAEPAHTESLSLEYIPDGMSTFERNTKRIFDAIFSAVLIIVFSPLMLICHIAIRRQDGGPSIYKQERIGRFGRPFHI